MVQNLSLSAPTGRTPSTFRNGGVFGSSSPPRRIRNLVPKTRIGVWEGRVFLVTGNGDSKSSLKRRESVARVRVRAGWLFKGGGGGDGGGDRSLDASSEQSESVNEDILVFFFQLDLATRVQYALNVEEYDMANQLRNKLTEVEAEVVRQQEAKRGSSSKSEVQDKGISMIRLRADLQKAVESENYALAAKLRDEISSLEADSLAASATALAHENTQYAFRLGQKLKHRVFGYRAVICGMDPVCCESSSWMETAQISKLPRGSNQPFYQVLVDVREDPNLLLAYVAEDNLVAFDPPDTNRFDHPYSSFLFLGVDAAGDFIAVKQLREKFNQPRHEIPLDSDDEEEGDD